MSNYSKFYDGDMSKLATVIAFDPGETTGYTLMGIRPDYLTSTGSEELGAFQDRMSHIEYGQIDCITGNGTGFDAQMNRHAGIALIQEAVGVSKMIDLCVDNLEAAIVLEDFIPDMNKMDKARHTLSPVRIIAAFSYGICMGEEIPFYSRLFIQQRSLAKTTCTDTRLKHWGLYDLHSGPHARDATRHAYYFLRSCRGAGEKAAENRWRAWPHLFGDPQAFKRESMGEFTGPRKRPDGERVHIK